MRVFDRAPFFTTFGASAVLFVVLEVSFSEHYPSTVTSKMQESAKKELKWIAQSIPKIPRRWGVALGIAEPEKPY